MASCHGSPSPVAADADEALRQAASQFSRAQSAQTTVAARVQQLQACADEVHRARQALIDTVSSATAEQVQAGPTEVREITLWWDNFISDFSMSQRINDARARTTRLLVGLDHLTDELGKRRLAALQRVDELLMRASREPDE